jgi:sugar lactone lactonase YvrE
MLRCPGDQILSAFIDGVLPAPQIAPLEAHLLNCDDCRRLMAALARTLRSGSQRGPPPSTEEPLLAPGAMVGRYQIIGALGAGGMGIVYEAHDRELGRRIAVKILRGSGPPELQRELVLREAQALARLSHPNVIAVYDVAWVGERICVAMELVDGGTLREWLRKAKRQPREVLSVLLQAGRGLAAAHAAGMVHRDFKPDNILVGLDGRARVTDFGLARLAADRPERALIGSPAYMAPEQLAGDEAGPRSDLFSFCATAWEALAGERPFSGKSVEELRAAIARGEVRGAPPQKFRAALLRGLAAAPEARPASMDALLGTLERAAARRSRTLAVAAAVLALAIAALLLRPRPPPWRPEVVPMLPVAEEGASFPAFSPDGRWLAYASDRDGWSRLFVAPAGGGVARALTPPGLTAVYPRWTPDGSALFLLDNKETLYRVPLDGGAPVQLIRGPRAFASCAGRLVLSLRGRPACADCPMLVERSAAGDRVIVEESARAVINDVRCDAGGSKLVYSESDHEGHWLENASVWVVPLEGGKPRRITDGPSFDFNPTFHPDGRSVIFSRWQKSRARLWEVPVAGGRPVQLTFSESEDEDKAPEISPDGRTLIYVNDREVWELQAYSPRRGTRVRLSRDKEDVARIAVSANEVIGEVREYGSTTRRSHIKTWPLHGGESRELGEGIVPTLTPDQAELLFGQPAGAAAWRVVAVSPRGGPARVVTEVLGDVKNIGVGIDGVVHVTVRGDRGLSLYRAPLAGGRAEIEPGPPYARLPSPAGGWTLAWTPRAQGGNEGALLVEGSSTPAFTFELKRMAWAPKGDAFVYFTGSELRRHVIANGADEPLFPTHEVNGIAVSPDGETIYVSEVRGETVRRMITNFADRR